MESSDLATAMTSPAPLSERRENVTPISPKIAELTESRKELLGRIQSLKQDLQNWRLKLDSQVKVYHEELSELKKSLNNEVENLRTKCKEVQVLKTTLQQQQDNVSSSLKKFELQVQDDSIESEGPKAV